MLVTSGAEKFEGWMIQAHDQNTGYIVGSFVPSATPDGAAKGIMCVRTPNDTLTQAGAACTASSEEMSG